MPPKTLLCDRRNQSQKVPPVSSQKVPKVSGTMWSQNIYSALWILGRLESQKQSLHKQWGRKARGDRDNNQTSRDGGDRRLEGKVQLWLLLTYPSQFWQHVFKSLQVTKKTVTTAATHQNCICVLFSCRQTKTDTDIKTSWHRHEPIVCLPAVAAEGVHQIPKQTDYQIRTLKRLWQS